MGRHRIFTVLFSSALLGAAGVTAAAQADLAPENVTVTAQAETAPENNGDRSAGEGPSDPVLTAADDSALYESLETSDGRQIYLVLPEDYDPAREYPSVYLMPPDGFSARQYLEDGIAGVLRDLMRTDEVLDMVFVLPQFGEQEAGADGDGISDRSVDFDLYGQLEASIAAVEEQYSVIPDPAFRGTAGTGTGGYLSFLLGYLDRDGNLNEEPAYFRAIASHDGIFTGTGAEESAEADGEESGDAGAEESAEADGDERWNPYAGSRPAIYDALYGSVNTHYASECEWVKNYYTYIDSNSGSPLAAAPGGSDDISLLFRTDALDPHHSASSWDYGVFEYSSRTAEHYGSYLNNLERSLNRFSLLFGLEPEEEEETEYVPAEPVTQGQDRMIDLMGDWHFQAYKGLSAFGGSEDLDRIDYLLEEADWESWETVQPALDWWTEDFAPSLQGNPWFAGYAWYVRSFSVPESFGLSGLLLKAGMMDEGDEVYVNGVRVGATGIPEEGGSYDMTNPWDLERVYPLPDGLLQTGENTIAVRVCNSSGAGGWYAGPVCICAGQEDPPEETEKERVYETSMVSEALGGREVIYRVYLPEGYYESSRRYPVVYMLHGIGSTGKSFIIDGVPELLDEGIAEGTIPPCIFIFPDDSHPNKMSWWKDIYADMLNKDLIREVDSSLRTIPDRRYRGIAGESMGGGGAYLNALRHPGLYSWIFDIYGAINFAGIYPVMTDEGTKAPFLGQFRQYFIAGNHDAYTFDLVHIPYARKLDELGVDYRFEIDNGEHSAAFFLPYLKEAFGYLMENVSAYEAAIRKETASAKETASGKENAAGKNAVSGQENAAGKDAVSVKETVSGQETKEGESKVHIRDLRTDLKDGILEISFRAEIGDYSGLLPHYVAKPSDLEETAGSLTVPLYVTVTADGRTILERTQLWTLDPDGTGAEEEFHLPLELPEPEDLSADALQTQVTADLSWAFID